MEASSLIVPALVIVIFGGLTILYGERAQGFRRLCLAGWASLCLWRANRHTWKALIWRDRFSAAHRRSLTPAPSARTTPET